MYYLNEMGLPKVYEDDILSIFLVEEDEEESDEEEEETQIKKEPHYSQGGISQFSFPIMSDKLEELLLSIIGG
tara:strand:+ start:248 stop:466 length:219 start_codon:yes stop_codon:yes gene_type:complete